MSRANYGANEQPRGCPHCGCSETSIVDVDKDLGAETIYRRRKCKNPRCQGATFLTVERMTRQEVLFEAKRRKEKKMVMPPPVIETAVKRKRGRPRKNKKTTL